MRDIVATIQADQYRLITSPPDSPLVIQGGPGTGKTAVGLHRASWLLYTARERSARSRVLVVGPNRTFMEYVSHVLPALGEDAVEQRAVSELVDGVEPTVNEPGDVVRLKGDGRMADVIARAAEIRLRGGARRAAAPPRRRVRPCPRPRPGAAPRRGARGARHDGRRARALPDGAGPELLRRVRPPPRGRRDARRGAGRARAPVERRAPARPRSRLARRRPGQARPGAVHDAGLPGRGGRGCPRRRRAAAPAPSRRRMGRGGRRTARRGASAGRRACAGVRPRHRRRGPGPLADAAADDRAAREGEGADDARRHRPGNRVARLRDVGRGGRTPARRRRGGDRGAASRVPRAARDHGARAPAARHDRTADRAASRVPGRDRPSRSSAGSPRTRSSARRTASPASSRGRRGSSR